MFYIIVILSLAQFLFGISRKKKKKTYTERGTQNKYPVDRFFGKYCKIDRRESYWQIELKYGNFTSGYNY